MLKRRKPKTYTTLVRPTFEYSSTVWDPYRKSQINQTKNIQRRAAPFVLHDYSRYNSVTKMLTILKWPSLHNRMEVARLSVF